MKTKDWVIGRGMNGQYLCPILDVSNDTWIQKHDRNRLFKYNFERWIGKLWLIVTYYSPAIFKGLFYSENMLSKAASLWILIWLFSLYPTTVTTFSLNYLLVWVSIGICYSKNIRNIPDDNLREYFRTGYVIYQIPYIFYS